MIMDSCNKTEDPRKDPCYKIKDPFNKIKDPCNKIEDPCNIVEDPFKTAIAKDWGSMQKQFRKYGVIFWTHKDNLLTKSFRL